jgi:hypothetical protein
MLNHVVTSLAVDGGVVAALGADVVRVGGTDDTLLARPTLF